MIVPSNVFSDCVVKVPAASLDKYKTDKGWKDFKNIIGVDITGIGDAATVHPSSPTRTYNLQGQPVGDGFKGIVIQNGRKVLRK